MRDAVAEALGNEGVLVVARDLGAVNEARAAAQTANFVLLLIEPTVPKLDSAMLAAALGPLAEEIAPAGRIAALHVVEGAAATDVAAAARYLAGALSTTGQVLRVTPN